MPARRPALTEGLLTNEKKLLNVHELQTQVRDPIFIRFFDTMSAEMPDKKMEALQQIIDGKTPGEINGCYDALERMPKDGERWG